jgi:glycyl-tRNA synthetase beta chain
MPEFFIELFSEEIPARMQQAAAAELSKICTTLLAALAPADIRLFYGPRRIALRATIAAEKPGGTVEARGPRDSAPDQALAGFLAKNRVTREELVIQDGYFWLRRSEPPIAATALILDNLGPALAKFSWPKSMRWGQSENFTWVRPLRRIILLLDGAIIPITLGPVTAGAETEGHRVHAPGAFTVKSARDWQEQLREKFVIADQDERRTLIQDGLAQRAAAHGLRIAEDSGLLDEVTGLVEFPVPLIGQIDQDFMDLPPEVRELSMKVNQKYFALRDAAGLPAPNFAFGANLATADGGAAIIAGNERVLRARLSDARHFWDLDRKTPLSEFLPKLEKITFHAKIGTQLDRSVRIAALAEKIAGALGGDAALAQQAGLAGYFCKADLVTGMVGEFPELQGTMGGYYAALNPQGWDGNIVGPAIKTHYQPKSASDVVPRGIVAAGVALADKLDTLTAFFKIGEKPSGSGDPYALRRAALGVIRIILENNFTLPLLPLLGHDQALFDFIIERLRVKLRGEGERFDILDAVLNAGTDDDLVRIMQRVSAVRDFLATADGTNLLVAYRRAANILRIEDSKDGPHKPEPVDGPLPLPAETALRDMLATIQTDAVAAFAAGNFADAMLALARLRTLVDDFFAQVTVNAAEPQNRLNRLRLLAQLRDTMHQIADFSKIEG